MKAIGEKATVVHTVPRWNTLDHHTAHTHTHTHTRHIRFWRREANGKMTTEWKCCVCPPPAVTLGPVSPRFAPSCSLPHAVTLLSLFLSFHALQLMPPPSSPCSLSVSLCQPKVSLCCSSSPLSLEAFLSNPRNLWRPFFFSSFLPVDNLHFILLHQFSFIHLLHVLRNYFSLADLTLTSLALFR